MSRHMQNAEKSNIMKKVSKQPKESQRTPTLQRRRKKRITSNFSEIMQSGREWH